VNLFSIEKQGRKGLHPFRAIFGGSLWRAEGGGLRAGMRVRGVGRARGLWEECGTGRGAGAGPSEPQSEKFRAVTTGSESLCVHTKIGRGPLNSMTSTSSS
jgi:hypothetical protein